MADWTDMLLGGKSSDAPLPAGVTSPSGRDWTSAILGGQELTQGSGRTTGSFNPDLPSPATFEQRKNVGIKITPEGKRGYLESIYGRGNAIVDQGGNLFVRKSPAEDWARFDPKGFDWGDIPEVGMPVALEALPVMMSRGTPVGTATGAATGSLLRQAVSNALPGEEGLTPQQRTEMTAQAALLGGGTQAVINAPRATTAWLARRGVNKPIGRAGQEIENVMREGGNEGFHFSPGQQTQSRSLLLLEGFARRHPITATKVQNIDEKVMAAGLNRLDQALTRINAGEVGDESLGNSVKDAFNRVFDSAVGARSAQSRADFALVNRLSSGNKILPVANARQAIDDLIQEFDVVGAGPAAADMAKKLKVLRTEFTDTPPGTKHIGTILQKPGAPALLTADHFQLLMQRYGQMASGKGGMFDQLSTAQERMVARKVLAGLRTDLDVAAQGTGLPAPVAEALQAARNNYRVNSESIDAMSNTVLGRYFNVDGPVTAERISDKLLGMKPSEIYQSLDIIERAKPEITAGIQKRVIERAMEKAEPKLTTGDPAQGGKFSPAKFVSNLPGDAQFNAIFRNQPAAAQEIKTIAAAFERLANKQGEGSPTAPLAFIVTAVGGLGALAVAPLNPAAYVAAGTAVLTPAVIARAMASKEGREALMTVSRKAAPGTRKWAAALTYFGIKPAVDELTGNK